eukprot:7491202-Heterocapsa_arctica.AAC.1
MATSSPKNTRSAGAYWWVETTMFPRAVTSLDLIIGATLLAAMHGDQPCSQSLVLGVTECFRSPLSCPDGR